MSRDNRRDIIRIQLQKLKVMWESVASWFAKSRGEGSGFIPKHTRKYHRQTAEMEYDRFANGVEKLIKDAYESGMTIGGVAIVGPEEKELKKRKSPPKGGYKEAA